MCECYNLVILYKQILKALLNWDNISIKHKLEILLFSLNIHFLSLTYLKMWFKSYIPICKTCEDPY